MTIRLGTLLIIWLFSLIALAFGAIGPRSLAGTSITCGAVTVLALVGLPLFRRLKSPFSYTVWSIVDLVLVVFGYTGIIYSVGGVGATYLVPIYAVFISYVGIAGTMKIPWSLATAGAVSFSAMVLLQQQGVIPEMNALGPKFPSDRIPVLILVSVAALMYAVAFITAFVRDLLKRTFDNLEQQSLDLAQARDSALRANSLKLQLLASASHELRTPLTQIIGFSQLLRDERTGKLNETQAEYLEDVCGSGEHLLGLVDDLLDLSKLEAGKMPLERDDTPVAPLLEESLDLARKWAEGKRIRFSLETDPSAPSIHADPRKLKLVLINLLTNAVKFCEGGGEIALRAQSADQDSTGRKLVEFSVSDTGTGIAREQADRIFEPFEQAGQSDVVSPRSTGLGLAIAREIVNSHGGRIWAESPGRGRGSVFRFVIPVA